LPASPGSWGSPCRGRHRGTATRLVTAPTLSSRWATTTPSDVDHGALRRPSRCGPGRAWAVRTESRSSGTQRHLPQVAAGGHAGQRQRRTVLAGRLRRLRRRVLLRQCPGDAG
jgi:hypothetical protein